MTVLGTQEERADMKATRAKSLTGSRASGFTLIELIVSMLIMVTVIIGVLALFDTNNKVARIQINLADLQQSQRIAQYELVRNIRMAARGGLPTRLIPDPAATPAFAGRSLPTGLAIEVNNNVADATRIGDNTSPEVLEGSDILTVRGIFNSDVYAVNPAAGFLTLTGSTGTLIVQNVTITGLKQDLSPLLDTANTGVDEALLLISPLDDIIYAVVEMDAAATAASAVTTSGEITQITVNFKVTGGTNTAGYASLSPSGGFPDTMQTIAFIGVLEEYKYYVRKIADTAAAGLTTRLSRARFFPGTTVAYAGQALNLRTDIADNVLDLQIALGVDRDGDESILEGTVADPTPNGTDEWLFNAAADSAPFTSANWNNTTLNLRPHLYYLRVTTLTRTDKRDNTYTAPAIQNIEDHIYDGSTPASEPGERKYRRRQLQTVIDLRNIS